MTKSRPGSIFSSVSKSYNPYKSSAPKDPPPDDEFIQSAITKQKIEWSYDNEEIIAEWCDIAQCYKWLHYHSKQYYYRLHAWFTIPAITFSTISGTASFASASIPHEYQPFAPMIIGTINIFIGILTTVQQYLKISELKEAHRIASISWDKYARNISIELSKKPLERIDAGTFLKFSRKEFDRLMEFNPGIPLHIIRKFKEAFRGRNHEERRHFKLIKKPDICDVIVSINEKRHMWFPKRDTLIFSPMNDENSASVEEEEEEEDVETGSTSTLDPPSKPRINTKRFSELAVEGREKTRRQSSSNGTAFSQENLMKHNRDLRKDPSRARSASFVKSPTRSSMNRNQSVVMDRQSPLPKDSEFPERRLSEQGNAKSLREYVSSIHIPRPYAYTHSNSSVKGEITPTPQSSASANGIRPEDMTMGKLQVTANLATNYFPSLPFFSTPSVASKEDPRPDSRRGSENRRTPNSHGLRPPESSSLSGWRHSASLPLTTPKGVSNRTMESTPDVAKSPESTSTGQSPYEVGKGTKNDKVPQPGKELDSGGRSPYVFSKGGSSILSPNSPQPGKELDSGGRSPYVFSKGGSVPNSPQLENSRTVQGPRPNALGSTPINYTASSSTLATLTPPRSPSYTEFIHQTKKDIPTGMFRNTTPTVSSASVACPEEPQTLIPFCDVLPVRKSPEEDVEDPTASRSVIAHTDSSSGNDSGNSHSSILVTQPYTKNHSKKKKVRHEGYANTSDSEVDYVGNILFTQHEYQWSDSEEDPNATGMIEYVPPVTVFENIPTVVSPTMVVVSEEDGNIPPEFVSTISSTSFDSSEIES